MNDDEDTLQGIAERIRGELGAETPWHVSGYFPAYKFHAPPPPRKTLEHARNLGRQAGLDFVYIGNMPGHPYDNTHCPDCGETLIVRYGFDILQYHLTDGRCPRCGRSIPGVGWK